MEASQQIRSKPPTLLRLARQWRRRRFVAGIRHEAVVSHVRSEGRMTCQYAFMAMISCAIAILGLLQSSPAVVIGAMLISPLMAPIVSLGFSLSLLDARQMRRALEGLVGGIILSLAVSWLIVTASPLTDATPEIMARTKPNLFDLMVAIFSGLAGGHAVIRRKDEAIVGVAIATALMPPLAVIGFGIATGSRPIAMGAFMLFMTNLLAVALSVTLLAKFYGFGGEHSPKHTVWKLALIIIVFGVLSLPLGAALKDIAWQTYVAKTAKGMIKTYFGGDKSRLTEFSISFSQENGASIDAVVLTPRYRPRAQRDLRLLLVGKAGRNLTLALDQVVVAQEVIKEALPKPVADSTIAPVLPSPPQATRAQEMVSALKQETFFPVEYIKADVESKRAGIFAAPGTDIDIAALRRFEDDMQQKFPEWSIAVTPPFQALPALVFAAGSDRLAEDEAKKLEDIVVWALRRWNVRRVDVVGFAGSMKDYERFDKRTRVGRRVAGVAEKLKAANIEARPRAEYRGARRGKKQPPQANDALHQVEIRPLLPTAQSAAAPAVKATATK